MDETARPTEALLEDLAWLQELARRLVRDPERAEDAVQDAALVALRTPRTEVRSWRGWLAGVLRNALRQEARGSRRRSEREARLPQPEPARATDAIVEELALHRRLIGLVEDLREPYGSTVARRFLQARTVRDIASEDGVPPKTVHTRIERGLAILRTKLDAQERDWRGTWGALLSPGCPSKEASVAAGAAGTKGVWMTISLKWVVGIGVVAAAGVLVTLPFVGRERPRGSGPVSDHGRQESASASITAGDGGSSEARQSAALSGLMAPSAEDEAVSGRALLVGSVHDFTGRPVAGVAVRFEPRGAAQPSDAEWVSAPSAADGSFELPLPTEEGRLTVENEDYACLVSPHLNGEPPLEPPLVIVAPKRTYSGRVVDEVGVPLPKASVNLTLAGSWIQAHRLESLGRSIHLLLPFEERLTDERGEFSIEGVGYVQDALLQAERDGYESAEMVLPAQTTHTIVLELRRAGADQKLAHGVVFDDQHRPVFDALVSFGLECVRTDHEGRFALPYVSWQKERVVRAFKPGYQPARQRVDPEEAAGSARETLELYLGSPPKTIRGRVVGPDGQEVPFARVWTPDTTFFGSVEHEEEGRMYLGVSSIEAVQNGGGGPSELVLRTQADAGGRFELRGLEDRDYVVFALHPLTLAAAGPVSIRAGDEGAELLLRTSAPTDVRGRVTSTAGRPLAGLSIRIGRALKWDRPMDSTATKSWKSGPMSPPRPWTSAATEFTTDAQGRFSLLGIETEGTYISFTGKELYQLSTIQLDEEPNLEDIQVVAKTASRFRLRLLNPDRADAFQIPDNDDVLTVEVERSQISMPKVEILDGVSGVVLYPSGTHELVLLDGEVEVERRTIELAPGGVHEIEL